MRDPSEVGGIVIDLTPGAKKARAPVDSPLTGPSANFSVRALEQRRKDWPYDWIYPPENSIRVRASNSIAAPAAATQTVVLAYTVPAGYYFVMAGLVQTLVITVGSAFVQGSGSVTWTIDVNTQIGITGPIGYPVQGFTNEVVTLGSTVIPWPLVRPDEFNENDVIRSKITTTAAITAGAGNYFTSMFLGWILPESSRRG
jgi:hypothetical protein